MWKSNLFWRYFYKIILFLFYLGGKIYTYLYLDLLLFCIRIVPRIEHPLYICRRCHVLWYLKDCRWQLRIENVRESCADLYNIPIVCHMDIKGRTSISSELINKTINKIIKDIFHDIKFCYLNIYIANSGRWQIRYWWKNV
jgi:hypothetical protein